MPRIVSSFPSALAVIAATVLCHAPSAEAYVRSESQWNPTSLPIRYRWNPATVPASLGAAAAQQAIEAGMASWSAPTCTRWRSTNAGTTALTRGRTSDRENSFLWINSNWPPEFGDVDSTIGVTTPVWQQGGYVIDADIQYNGIGFRWSTTGASGTVDTQSIATHEEGHFLGLDHSSQSGAVMFASYSGGTKRVLNADDQAGVCAIYPAGSTVPVDAGTSSDPCAAFNSCASCTPVNGCGWCGARSRCESGGSSGPSGAACSGSWAWLSDECSAMGNSGFGEPCSAPTDCASGGICVSDGTRTFCSRACTDDCTCPTGYACRMTTTGTRLCGPGTNTCGRDAGVRDTGVVTEEPDAGEEETPDAEVPVDMDAGSDGGSRGMEQSPGCACATPGLPARRPMDGGSTRALSLASLLALTVLVRRRR